ncbi:MAG: glycoside hydrolase family 88 protein [Defluviitaleaceae bacterium]|nr:glycoside hydrolase family 88 protein [Defluviitaleaceae bacterium]
MYSKIIDMANKFIDDSSPEKPAWNQEVLLGHIKPGWNYIDGCMIKAFLDLYDATQDRRYLDFADNYVDCFISGDGSILGYKQEDYNIDHINEGKVLFTLHRLFGKEKYRKAIDVLYNQLMDHPRTKSGNFWHKKIYPNQVWLDGLYMALPFYAEYETLFNESKNTRDIFTQFKNVYENMRDTSNGLMYHGRDESHECFWADPTTGLSKNFWSRSLGWYCMALLNTAEKIDERQFYERETLIRHLREIVDAVLKVSDKETGMLWQVTTAHGKDGNYLETSASCAFAYTLMKGARLSFLPEYYFGRGKRIFDSVVSEKLKETAEGLVLTDICLVAGLGVYQGKGSYKERDGTYEYYISEPRVDNDAKGVAPFFMAYAEVYRKERVKL